VFTINNLITTPKINKKWLNKIIKIEHDPLSFIQIIPHYNIINGRKIDNIVDGLHSMEKSIFERVSLDWENKKIIYETEKRFTYGIVIEHNKASFYLSVPSQWQNWICQRIYSTHTSSVTTLQNQEDYLNYFDENYTLEWKLKPKYKGFKSFITDYRENTPIPSILSCQKDLRPGDKILLELNCKPIDDMWKETFIKLQSDFRKGRTEGLNKNFSLFILFDLIMYVVDIIMKFIEMLLEMGDKENTEDKYIEDRVARVENKLESHSLQKVNYNGFATKIRILSQSTDPVRQEMMAKTMFNALKDIAEGADNEFIIISKKKNQIHRPKIILNFNSHIFSTKELGQIQQLPERKWQNEYKMEKKDIQEIPLPNQLFEGGVPIGKVTWKGETRMVYWNDVDKDVSCLPKATFAFQGYGKTEQLIRYAIESIKRKHSIFVFDGIDKCQMSTKILNYLPSDFPEEKIIVLQPCNLENVIPLSWSEVDVSSLKDISEIYKLANKLTQELILLLDSFVEDNSQKLTPRMRRYLTSASTLVFSLPGTNIIDVLDCLDDYEKRHEFIKKSGLPKRNKIVQDLLKLDNIKYDNKGEIVEVGTKDQDIKFIIDRLDLLLSDFVLRQLFLAKPNPEINFRKWADEGYCVLIQMPEEDTNVSTIDTITTFLISKLWLAMQGRKTDRQVDVIIDEIHKLKTAKKQLDNIREHRKRRLSYFFSAHKPDDFGKMLETLKSAGASFMLLGTSRNNLEHFKYEIQPFTIEECLETKKYHAKCIINYDKEFVTFDADLNGLVVDKTEKYTDRTHIIRKCAKKYGVKLEEFY